MPRDWTDGIAAKLDYEREFGEPADPEERLRLARAQASKKLARLDEADRWLYVLFNSRLRFPKIELARRLGISRSTLYERIARIQKELEPRTCACGCGWELPRKSTRRRRYLNETHRGRATARRRRASSVPDRR